MSLPNNPKQAWPPAGVPALDFAVWDEWYRGAFAPAGDPLSQVPVTSSGVTERLTGGFVHRHANLQQGSAAARRPSSQPLHCPLAADIAQVSADLLFGHMPGLRVTSAQAGKSSQKRLDELLGPAGAQNELLEAAETCAALGGCYLRVTWDKAIAAAPFLTHVDADHAVPEFRFGRLVAVTFWRIVAKDGKLVYRHLERHEKGLILHGLYLGDASLLGSQIDLQANDETKGLTDTVGLPESLPGGLSAYYVPNVRPNQRDRGSYLGRADVAGAEDFLDALDETWSGLMRDVRLGQSRILVPSGTLEQNSPSGRGSGKSLDLDREVFTEIDVPPEGLQPMVAQPEIRTEQLLTAAVELVKTIVSKAGYSPQTFGLEISGQAESGTALRIREQKTYRTLGRKRRYWESGLKLASAGLLAVDAAEFGGKATSVLPEVVWQEEGTGLGEMSRIMLDLRNAESASTETRVRMFNPGWDDTQVLAEVERIKAETSTIVPAL